MPPVGFEPTIAARERPQTYALDRTATGTGRLYSLYIPLIYYTLTVYVSVIWMNMDIHLPSCFMLMNISLAPETVSAVLYNMSLPMYTEKPTWEF